MNNYIKLYENFNNDFWTKLSVNKPIKDGFYLASNSNKVRGVCVYEFINDKWLIDDVLVDEPYVWAEIPNID